MSALTCTRWIFSAFVCAFPVWTGFAVDLYVSPSGDDTAGTGSKANPYREIRRACEAIKPGDTVLVADGTYKGFTLNNLKGTEARPIVVKAQGKSAEVVPTTDRKDNRDTIYLDGCAYIVLDGLRSYRANRAAVRLEACDHVTVRNGTFGDNGNWGIFTGHSDDLLIESNECYGSVREHGIYVSNSGDRPVIRGNRVHDNSGCGIHMNGDLNCGGDGIISGALVENNIIYGNGRKGGGGINMDGVQDSLILNNLLYDNHATGITCFRGDGAAGPRGQRIVHNTIVMPADARYALQFGQTTGTNLVRNNILYNLNPARGGLALNNEAEDAAHVDSDYNIFSIEAPVVAVDDWKTRHALVKWQAMGHEKHSFASSQSELFSGANRNDFHLAPRSPAIAKGTRLESVRYDSAGIPLSKAPSIGCFQPL